jgi:hypothetical protein
MYVPVLEFLPGPLKLVVLVSELGLGRAVPEVGEVSVKLGVGR